MISQLLKTLAGFILVIISLQGVAFNKSIAATMDISKAPWQEDIRYYAKELEKKHLNLFHTLSKQEFDQEIKALLANTEILTSVQITAELIRITQRIDDGHTSVSRVNFSTKFPLKVKLYDDQEIAFSLSVPQGKKRRNTSSEIGTGTGSKYISAQLAQAFSRNYKITNKETEKYWTTKISISLKQYKKTLESVELS